MKRKWKRGEKGKRDFESKERGKVKSIRLRKGGMREKT